MNNRASLSFLPFSVSLLLCRPYALGCLFINVVVSPQAKENCQHIPHLRQDSQNVQYLMSAHRYDTVLGEARMFIEVYT